MSEVDLSEDATRARLAAMTDQQLAGWHRVTAGSSDDMYRRLLSEEIGRRDAAGPQ